MRRTSKKEKDLEFWISEDMYDMMGLKYHYAEVQEQAMNLPVLSRIL
jgi:hypothetical protein